MTYPTFPEASAAMPLHQPPATLRALDEEGGMDLLLWRHAEAEDGYPDIERRLTARGEQQAAKMAAWINAHAPNYLIILASPARRCQQTAQALQRPFTTDRRLGTDGDATSLLAAAGWPEGPSSDRSRAAVLIVGHQPTLGEVAALLLSGQEAAWTVKKGGLWWFSNRTHRRETQTVLRAVISSDIA